MFLLQSEITCSNLFSSAKNYRAKTVLSELKNNTFDGILFNLRELNLKKNYFKYSILER